MGLVRSGCLLHLSRVIARVALLEAALICVWWFKGSGVRPAKFPLERGVYESTERAAPRAFPSGMLNGGQSWTEHFFFFRHEKGYVIYVCGMYVRVRRCIMQVLGP